MPKGFVPKSAFKEGNAGKPKGAVSKKTLLLKSLSGMSLKQDIEGLMDGRLFDKFVRELEALDGAQFTNAYLTLLEYVKPKLSRMEIVEEKETVVINVFGKTIEDKTTNTHKLKQIEDNESSPLDI